MGCCANKMADQIEYQLIQEKDDQRSVHRMILLGIKSSGKTSIRKQLNCIWGKKEQYEDNLQNNSVMNIRQNCIDNMLVLCEINNDEQCIETLTQLDVQNDADLDAISSFMHAIWRRNNIKLSYSLRFHVDDTNMKYAHLLDDNMEYFFDKIDEIMQINYEPSSEDILKCKTVKYSVTDSSFYFGSHSIFNFIDLGDYDCKSQIYSDVIQKGHFDDRTVIFTAALSDYCIYDTDAKKMKIKVSIDYLKEIMSSSYFRSNNIILIFTKLDIFYDCIKSGISLSNCFADWNGPDYVNPKIRLVVTYIIRNEFIYVTDDIVELIQNYIVMENGTAKSSAFCGSEATQFIAEKYDEVNENRRARQLYIHKANCMDTTNVEKVFTDVRHIVINSNLARGPI